jgi:ABC-type transport system involved in cytochrome c biogenesis permease subunit
MLLYWFQSSALIGSKWLAFNRKRFFSNFTNYLSLFKMGRIRSFSISNLYESLLFLSWVLTFLLVVSNIKQVCIFR